VVWQALALLATHVVATPACWGISPSPLGFFLRKNKWLIASHCSLSNINKLKK